MYVCLVLFFIQSVSPEIIAMVCWTRLKTINNESISEPQAHIRVPCHHCMTTLCTFVADTLQALPFRFHDNHSKSVVLSEDKRTAARREGGGGGGHGHGIVMSRDPMEVNQLYEVRCGLDLYFRQGGTRVAQWLGRGGGGGARHRHVARPHGQPAVRGQM